MIERTPSVSVIVPAFNAEAVLPECLEALKQSTLPPVEIIVVNDGSTDRTASIARRYEVKLLETSRQQSGPAIARNLAAKVAVSDVLLFVDADVVIQPDTVSRICQHFAEDEALAAVFGSYDAEPKAINFLSQYKNLQHHYVHQSANPEADTFWAGCGAVRRKPFVDVGGFDAGNYSAPSIEDIELGYRLRARGCSIRLDPSIQVCHLKRWTFWRWLHTEIFCRAIPWSALMIKRNQVPMDLNVRLSDRLSAALVWFMLCSLPLILWHQWIFALTAAALAMLIFLNRQFYGFLLRLRGPWFVFRTLPVHALYYLYSSLSFVGCWVLYHSGSRQHRGH